MLFAILSIASLSVTTLMSCSKSVVEPVQAGQFDDKELRELKAHYAALVNVEPNQIEFDEERKMFRIFNHDQLDINQLRKIYKQSK